MFLPNKSGRRRTRDYYTTPLGTVREFVVTFSQLEPQFNFKATRFLDPCAGGDADTAMPYPTVLQEFEANKVDTIDLRPDSPAAIIGDYLDMAMPQYYDAIFTHPPFGYGMAFIEKAMKDVREGGYIAMMLRLDFYGAQKRKPFWVANMPKWTIVHSKRPSFTNGTTDAGEYAHLVWQKGFVTKYSDLIVI